MRPGIALVVLLLPLAGCTNEPATFRFKGQLDRGLSESEQAEVRQLAGTDFTVESTLVGCPPKVDPYDCNAHWLRVDGITRSRCDRLVDRLQDRTYWRGSPTCDEPVA